jgi:hypothetical protein
MLSSVQLTTAVNSSVTSDWKNQSGSLSLSDSNDVYRFTLSKASTVNLNLGAVGTGNLVALVKDTNGNNRIEDAEVLFKSSQSADVASVQLNAGTYYLVADLTTLPGGNASTLYQVGASLASQSSVLWRDTTPGGANQVGLWNFGTTPQGPTMTSTELVFSNVDANWKVEAVGDFNGDGISDVFWRNKVSNVTTVWILDEQANILSQGETLTPVDNTWTVIGAGDVNGDGKDDLIWRKGGTTTVVWRMNGSQIASGDLIKDLAGNLINMSVDWKLEQTADWNGDGKADLFWRNISINPVTNQASNEIEIWLMDDNKRQSSFSLGTIRPGQGFEIGAIGDLDANGTTDILWRHSDGRVRLWAMNREGKLATDQLMTDVMSNNWQTVGMNDVTGDGKVDILWRNNTSGQFLLWEMNGVTIKSRFDVQSADFTLGRSAVSITQQRVNPIQEVKLPQGSVLWRDGVTVGIWNFSSTTQGPQSGLTEQLWSGAVGTDWTVEGTGDMNGDGISDVLWRNTSSNQVRAD